MKLINTTLLITLISLISNNFSFGQTNTYIAGTGAWHVNGNWSLNHVPLANENVVIPNGADVTITIATPALALTLEVESEGTFLLKQGTFLNIINTGATGSRLKNTGVINNQGLITISNNGTGNHCIENVGTFAVFVNSGMIDINGYAGAGIHGIRNSNGAEFNNQSTGIINISDGNNTSSGSGIDNIGTGTEFNNDGDIVISNVRNGITNTANAVFENDSDIYLGDVKFDAGIENLSGALFHNKINGYITLEELNAVAGIEAIYNGAIFTNDGDIEIISPSGEGVDNRGATALFENNGTIEIGGVAADYGIINSSTATWAGTGETNSSKPFFQNWIYTTKGPNVARFDFDLELTGNAKDTMIVNGLGGGTGHDSIHVDGDIQLGGVLVIKSTNSYTTNFTDHFTLFAYSGSLSGTFSSISLPAGFSGFEIDLSTPGEVNLKHPDCNKETNLWVGGYGGKWDNPLNWQLGHVPEICEKVQINSGDSVVILSGNQSIREMDLDGILFIHEGTSLTINGFNTTPIGANISGKLINEGGLTIENIFGTEAVRAIAITNGELYNDGIIIMENIHHPTNGQFNSVLYMQGISNFINHPSGEIYISNVSMTAMRNQSTIPINNDGLIQIQNSSVGYGIWNFEVFTNTGEIIINNISNQAFIETSGTIQNEGTININGANVGVTASNNSTVINNGLINVSNSTGSSVIIDNTSHLGGSGTFINDSQILVNGIMSPGNSAGVISISNNLRQIVSTIDTFEIFGSVGGGQIAGHDSVHVGNILELQGKLVVQLKNGFIPTSNERFVLFSYGILAGSFDEIELPAELSNWIIDYSVPGEIALSRVSCTMATNTFIGNNNIWSMNANWSLSHVPTYCENVVIGNGKTVTIPNGFEAEALNIYVGTNSNLIINANATLSVDMQELNFPGIEIIGTVENHGEIVISNSKSRDCIRVSNGGNFSNFGEINISRLTGNNAVGVSCIFNSSFTNEISGQINITDMEFISSASVSSAANSELINKGTINVINGGSIAINTSSTIENFGTITSDTVQASQCMNIAGGSIFYNHSGAQLGLFNSLQNGSASNGIILQDGECQFINDGNITIQKIGNNGIFIPFPSIFENNGTVGLSNTGLLNVSGKDAVIEGTYKGTGELYGNNEMILDGVCSPGNSTSQLYFENTIIHSSSNIDSFQIGGTGFNQYDNIYILDGDLVLGGLIDIKLINGFTPNDSDIFTLFEVDGGGTITGSFLFVVLPVTMAGWELDFSLAGEVRLLKPACTASTNTWTGTNGIWSDATKWSLGHAPRYCEDVVIGSSGNVVIDDFYNAFAHSIDVNGGQLHLNPLSKLTIDVDHENKKGIDNRNGGIVFNGGDINIFDITGSNKDGITNCQTCMFTNNIGAEIHIFNIAGGLAEGIANTGNFINKNIITISDIANSNGLFNSLSSGDFNNSGTITIDNILNDGIQILGNSNFLNTGMITVSGCGNFGIRVASGAYFDQDGDVIVNQ